MTDSGAGPGLARIGGILREAAGERGVPGAVAAVGMGRRTLATWAAGLADATPGSARPMTAGTVFDPATHTTVVATTTAVLALAARGQLRLADPVPDYLPDFAACRPGPVTIRHLLTHTSGLPGTREFYRCCESRAQLLQALYRTDLQAPPGSRVTYSDLGFISLGEIVAAVAGKPLDAVTAELVTGPLGMAATGFAPLAVPLSRVAATERRADGTPWTGIVHDENARVLGGVAGHAGLFGTAADLARFAGWWVSDSGGPVPARLRRAAASCQTPGLAGRRGLGWTCPGDGYVILAGRWHPTAVSHTGFTGTSLALDPASGAWVVLLTNSVHHGRDATAVKALRRDVHAAAAAALLPAAAAG